MGKFLVKIWDEDNRQPIDSIEGDKIFVKKKFNKIWKDKL